jgi:hypothetical protein
MFTNMGLAKPPRPAASTPFNAAGRFVFGHFLSGKTIRDAGCRKATLNLWMQNVDRSRSSDRREMFEVTKYEFPHIFVTSRRTGETYKFLVGIEGLLANNKTRFDQRAAWQTAIAYLAHRERIQMGKTAAPARG